MVGVPSLTFIPTDIKLRTVPTFTALGIYERKGVHTRILILKISQNPWCDITIEIVILRGLEPS